MMHIIVCVKMVPLDISAGINYGHDRELQLNIADMSAVEAALRLKSADGIVTVVTMGTKASENILKDLLSRGVDHAVLLTDRKMAGADTYATGIALAEAIRYLGAYDCIFCGRRAIDGETGQVPGELAGRLRLSCITNVSRVKIKEGRMYCDRLLENGTAKLEVSFPAIVSFCEYSYNLRLPGIKGRRAAAEKKVVCLSAEDLGIKETQCGLKGSRTRVLEARQMENGLRNGIVETDIESGVERMVSMIKEKGI